MTDDNLQFTQRQIALGRMAADFLNSELFLYAEDMAEILREKALSELLVVDPEDQKRIRTLQTDATRFEDFKQWFIDLVTVGDNAYQEYILGESEEKGA